MKHREMRTYQKFILGFGHNRLATGDTQSMYTFMMCTIVQKEREKKEAYFDKQTAAEV